MVALFPKRATAAGLHSVRLGEDVSYRLSLYTTVNGVSAATGAVVQQCSYCPWTQEVAVGPLVWIQAWRRGGGNQERLPE